MQTAGYVLAGGASSRMGTNKAFLMLHGRALVEIAAAAVLEAAGTVTLVGPPQLYKPFGLPVIPDLRPGAGPLAGIEAALTHTPADCNLIVACDMPRVNPASLRRILSEALAHPEARCILPRGASRRPEPLCALYRREILAHISYALNVGIRKITVALQGSPIRYLDMPDDPAFQNVNTPEEWREYRLAPES